MTLNWVAVYNRLFSLIDRPGESYYSGPRFLSKVHEVDPYFPRYRQYLDARNASGKSTSRRDYFYDILLELPDGARMRVISSILDDVQQVDPDLASEIRGLMVGPAQAPTASVPSSAWGADRLNGYLSDMDASIAVAQYDRAVGLAYTCLEGFYGAFYREKHPGKTAPNEIIALSRAVREWLRSAIPEYPDEALALTNDISHAVDRARNRFSEAHFAGEAGRWLAIYSRDLVNTQIRLLLQFMSR